MGSQKKRIESRIEWQSEDIITYAQEKQGRIDVTGM